MSSDPLDGDPLGREKTPSIHDCTQISYHNNRSTMHSSTFEILKLTLTVIDSTKLTIGKQYEIFPYGLKSSKRNIKDGCVYAGSLDKIGEKRINDLILPSSEKGVGERHFMIKYIKGDPYTEKSAYSIRDMGEGMGTFIRLDRPLQLQTNLIISFGESHVITHSENERITMRFIEGPLNEEKFEFSPSQSPVKIGRMADCDIRVDDGSLSRYHCMVCWEHGWVLKDGDGEKLSTNGTWLFAENFFEVYDGVTFKVAETLFKAQLSNELANIKQ